MSSSPSETLPLEPTNRTGRDQINQKKATVMKRLAKYTHKHRDVRSMSASEALDYSEFLLNQYDVHATQQATDTFEIAKDYKKIKTLKDVMKSLTAYLITLLFLALVALLIAAFFYLYIYLKKDQLKSVVNFIMLGSALSFVLVFVVYVVLFMNMSGTVKKIMNLM